MKCFVCNNDSWQPLYKNLQKCGQCDFIRADDKYFNVDPKKVYKNNYYQTGQYFNYKIEKKALIKNFKNRLQEILKYKNNGKLLDIGCAYGYFLKVAKKYFDIYGIDLDRKTTKIASKNTNSKIFTGDFTKAKFIKNHFNVITSFDSIEHLKNPDKAIKIVKKILKNNGIFVIETSDIETLIPKLQKDNWRIIDPSVHLSYFSEATLMKLLNKHGFKVLDIQHVSVNRSFAQIAFRILGIQLEKPKFIAELPIPINTHDLMLIIATKKA